MIDNTVTLPSGCRWCGATQRSHGSRWTKEAGFHAYTPPTREQLADRMRARFTRPADTEEKTA